ncbi:glycosyltransferase family 2 protein [Microbacterium sp. ASV49]|uniref:Glycosyltransferase family 2 protein n=1 Tax=Microbacterium candidum TaxID=3041922 RepID=A0ABT7MV08_9MICO|nr:glycosyltransferase family 2 protein [Microbacterium sp. ASV49]MDL9978270.1 glycosyltransferase family 2 protein [Microbacterium sp. ASV49]
MTGSPGAGAPQVSVVICTRNRAGRLAESVSAVLAAVDDAARMGMAAELIVVDNGSTDTTRDVVAGFAARDERCRYVLEPQPGIGRARREGFSACRGDVVLWTDDDTAVPSQWVTTMARPLLEGNADAVVGGVSMSPSLRRPWMTDDLAARYFAHVPEPPLDRPGFIGANMGFVRRLGERIPFDERLGTARWPGSEDVLVYVQAIEAGFTIRGVRGAVVEHRFDPSRLDPARLRRQAEGYGRCDAYYFHHWLHASFRLPRLRIAFHAMAAAARRLAVRGNPYDERLLALVRDSAFHREMLALRHEPRRYARRGVGLVRTEEVESSS